MAALQQGASEAHHGFGRFFAAEWLARRGGNALLRSSCCHAIVGVCVSDYSCVLLFASHCKSPCPAVALLLQVSRLRKNELFAQKDG